MRVVRYSIVERVVDVPLQSREYPGFMLGAYKTNLASWVAEHGLIYRPSLSQLGPVPLVRINSACFTGDIFGDQRCDCNEQLHSALRRIRTEPGLVIYHFHHEGRGLGFTSKLAAYQKMIQDGSDTFRASLELSNRNDLRTYASAVAILGDLGIHRVRLMTNNPEKREVLESNGIEVVETLGLVSTRQELNGYLASKRRIQGHYFGHSRAPDIDVDVDGISTI